MFNQKHKLRRPDTDESADSAPQETDTRQVQSMECSPILPKTRAKPEINETITIRTEETSPVENVSRLKDAKNPANLRVNFAAESENLVRHYDEADLGCSALPVEDEEPRKEVSEKETVVPVVEEPPVPVPSSPRVTRNQKRDSSGNIHSAKAPEELKKEEPKSPAAKAEPPKKTTRTTRKTKKAEAVAEDKVKDDKAESVERKADPPTEKKKELPEEQQVDPPAKESAKEPESKPEPDVVTKKKVTRKPRKAAEEKQAAPVTAAAASPRVTRNQKRESNQGPATATAVSSPRVDRTPIKKHVPEQVQKGNQFQSPRSSPIKKIYTPKEVFRY